MAYIDAKNAVVVDGVVYSKDMKTLLRYPENKVGDSFTIPASVTTISSYAFNDAKVKKIDFERGSGITEIGGNSFIRALKLQSVVLPDGVETIGDMAFQFCINLETINTPKNLTLIRSYAFSDCFKLKDFKFHDGIKKVMSRAFENCVSLDVDSLNLPSSASIAKTAFYNKQAFASMRRFNVDPEIVANATSKIYSCTVVNVNEDDLQKIVRGEDSSPDFSKKLQETIKNVSYTSEYPTIPMIVHVVDRNVIEAFALMTIDKKHGYAVVWDATIRNSLKMSPTSDNRKPIFEAIKSRAEEFIADYNKRNPNGKIATIYVDNEINANKFTDLQKLLMQDRRLNSSLSDIPVVEHNGKRYSRFTLAKLDKQDISTR